jgi:hypothetical protein
MPRANTPQFSETIQLSQTGQARIFVQLNPDPTEGAEYYGRLNLSDSFGQSRGESEIIEVASDQFRNAFVKIGEVTRSTERGSSTFTQLVDQDLSSIWDEVFDYDRPFNMHILMGTTESPQDIGAWRSRFVLGNCRLTELTRGENVNPRSAEENAVFNINGTVTYWDVYPIGTVGFSDLGGSTVTKNLVDVAIRLTDDNRASEIIGLTTNASSTSPSAIVYVNTSDSATVTQEDITALSTDGLGNAVYVVGSNVLVLRNDGTEAHLYSTLADVRAANDNFTEITTGWVSSSGPNDAYIANSGNIFVAADGGYVYKLAGVASSPTALSAGGVTSQNLAAIDGYGQQIVATGASSAIIVSNNFGVSWSSATAPTSGLAIDAVAVVGRDKWYIGCGNGAAYYTGDGGTTWTQLSLLGSPTTIHDIEFYGRGTEFYFGYIIADDGSDVQIFRTNDSGNTWQATSPDINTNAIFSGVSAPTGLSVLNQNEVAVSGDTVLGWGIN